MVKVSKKKITGCMEFSQDVYWKINCPNLIMILSHGLLWNFFLKSVTLIIHFNFNTSGSWRVMIPLLNTLIHC